MFLRDIQAKSGMVGNYAMSFHAIAKPWLGARETTKSLYHTYTLGISMPFPIRYIHVYIQ